MQSSTEINRFNDYLQIIILLKHEGFQLKHWNSLWTEMNETKAKKSAINLNKISFKELLNENIMKFTTYIYKISNVKILYKFSIKTQNFTKNSKFLKL